MFRTRSLSAGVLALLFIFSSFVVYAPSVLSLTNQQRQLINAGSLWYDPDGSVSDCSVDYDLPYGVPNLGIAYDHFLSKGLSPEVAAGIIGNLRAESGRVEEDRLVLYGDRVQRDRSPYTYATDDNIGYGIAQWTYPGRKQRMLDFATALGKTIDNYQMQLDFIWFELTGEPPEDAPSTFDMSGRTTSAYRKLVNLETDDPNVDNASDVEKAAFIFNMDYEISSGAIAYRNNPTAEQYEDSHRGRINLSEDAYQRLFGSGQGLHVNCQITSTNGLIDTVVTYAWPDYVAGSPNPVAKPEYQAAVAAARANREFVGGGRFPGIDCGGYVTRVMRDSGFDPQYNSSEGNTTWQYRYLQNSEDWVRITPASTANLEPGDVAIYTRETTGRGAGHTMVFVGEVAGFNSNFSDAAYSTSDNWRPPSAGRASRNLLDPIFFWFRKVSNNGQISA